MKKSIAFLGALLFGSVTFGQVTKNDSIKKPSSRKVSTEDLKNFTEDEDVETATSTGEIKGKSLEKHSTFEKHTSDASASKFIKGGVTQKGKNVGSDAATTFEKQHYTIKLSNANKKAEDETKEEKANPENAVTTRKKHISNVKWTAVKAVKDSLPTPTSTTSNHYIKIGDIKGEK